MKVCLVKKGVLMVVWIGWLSQALGAAQPNPSDVRGMVRMEDGSAPAGFLGIELRPTDGRMDGLYRTQTHPNGDYELRQVAGGTYMLRVTTMHGDAIVEVPVTVQGPVAMLETRLPGSRAERSRGETVSAKRLRHVAPKAARKEFGRYLTSREEEDWAEAEEHLEKALALDGEFVEAWVNLGALHTRRQQWAQAAAEFERALSIDPACAPAWANRAFVYLHTGNAKAAEEAAKKALRYEPGNETTRYLLRLAELNQGKTPH